MAAKINNYFFGKSRIRICFSFWHCLVLILFSLQSALGQEELVFKHITTDNGLSNNKVNCIYSDSRGFMWFCTDGGLNRYDGYSFVTYRHDPNNSTTISDDFVICMCEEETGKFWIGTKNGLNLFDPVTEKFVRIELDKTTEPNIYGWVTAIIPCKAGGIWVASRSGLYRIISNSVHISWIDKKNSGKFVYQSNNVKMVHYTFCANDANSLNDNRLYCLHEDKNGILWVGSDCGGIARGALHKLLPGEKSDYPPIFKKYRYDADNPDNSMGRYLMSIYEDRYGNLWIGTWVDGLYRFNPVTEKITRCITNKYDPESINCNNVFYMTEDSYGDLWMATYGGGLNKIESDIINSDKPAFVHYLDNFEKEEGLSYNNLRSIYFDKLNQLWIGSLGNGIYKTIINRLFTIFRHEPKNSNSLSDNSISSVFKDSQGNIRIVTKSGFLNKLDTKNRSFSHYKLMNDNNNHFFPSIVETADKNLLIIYVNRILKFNPKTQKVTDFLKEINFPDSLERNGFSTVYFDHNKNILISIQHYAALFIKYNSHYHLKSILHDIPIFYNIFKDSRSNLWVATPNQGIYQLDTAFNLIMAIVHKNPDLNNSFGYVEDREGIIWGATSNGLIQINPSNKQYKYYDEQDGLCSRETRGILMDDHGYIWIATSRGLSRFDSRTKVFTNLDKKDGLPVSIFNTKSVCKGNNGELYFGSDDGLLMFHPDSVRFNQVPPAVCITDFKVFNKSVRIGEEIDGSVILNKAISYTSEIMLSYKSNVLQFEFAALNYLLPEDNKYAYRMEGVDKEWNLVNADRRFATYAGLQYGEYIFRVKASNNDGIWNDKGVTLKITIKPPWWNTWWFRIPGLFIFIALIIAAYRIRTYQIKMRNLELKEQVKERTAEIEAKSVQLQVVNKELESFAYSVAHDLRTPLRGIDGFSQVLLEEYQDKIDAQGKNYLQRVRSAAQRMAQLIDDILNLSRLNSAEMNIQQVNLSKIGREIADNLRTNQPERHVEFVIKEGIKVQGDERLLHVVLENLINNAWKFTSNHSSAHIEFGLQQNNERVAYFVRDDGAGFDMNYAQKLFGAFQRLHTTTEFPGTGIGLVTVQRIIHRHGGEVWAEAEVENGATFYFTIPEGVLK